MTEKCNKSYIFRLPGELLERLKEYCVDMNREVSSVIREAIEDYLDKEEGEEVFL